VLARVTFPYTLSVEDVAEVLIVHVAPVVVRDKQYLFKEYKSIDGEPLLALIMTSSAVVGSEAPPAPPEVVDHLAVSDQLPDPPTQYRVAI
jgi:hypothetical protein